MSKQRRSKVQIPQELVPYVSIIEGMPDIVLLTDSKLRLLAANKMVEEITGYSVDQEIGKSVVKYLVKKNRAKAAINVARAIRRGYTTDVEYTARFKYRTAPILLSSIALRDARGKFVGMLYLIKDISELKAAGEMARAVAVAKEKMEHARKNVKPKKKSNATKI